MLLHRSQCTDPPVIIILNRQSTPSIIAFAGSLTVLFSTFVLHPVKIIAVIATIPNFQITLPNFFFILSRFSLLCFQIQSKS